MKKLILLSLGIFLMNYTYAQNKGTRLSVELGSGVPVFFTKMQPSFAPMTHVGAKFAWNSSISFGVNYQLFSFDYRPLSVVSQPVPGGIPSANESDYRRIKNNFYAITFIGTLNLSKALGFTLLENKFIPYVNVGGGYFFNNVEATSVDGSAEIFKISKYAKFPSNFFTCGIAAKYYLNPNVDVIAGVDYNMIDSYYADAFGADRKYDAYLHNYIGLNYKIGAKRANQHVDWKHLERDDSRNSVANKYFTRFSADVNLGMPYLFTNLGQNVNTLMDLGVRYSYSPILSIQAQYSILAVSGKQTDVNATILNNDKDISTYKASLSQINFNMLLNMTQLVNAYKKANNNFYLMGGLGFIYHDVETELVDKTINIIDKTYRKPWYDYHVGAQLRHKINYKLDLIVGSEFHFIETKYIDGTPNDGGSNHYISGFAGLSYKIASSATRELIDWATVIEKKVSLPMEKIKVIEKPITQEQPKVVPSPEIAKAEEQIKVATEQLKEATQELKVATQELKVAKEQIIEKTPVIETPKPIVEKTPEVIQNVQKENSQIASGVTGEVLAPPAKFSVIVGCYGLGRKSIALNLINKLKTQGYNASIYYSKGSKYFRVSVASTNDETEAKNLLRKSKSEVDPMSWIFVQ